MQPLWRFIDSASDDRLLIYRSEDIKNLSRIASPKVCGYVHAQNKDLLPQSARRDWDEKEEMDAINGEFSCLVSSLDCGKSCLCVRVSIQASVVEICRRKMECMRGLRSLIDSVLLLVDG